MRRTSPPNRPARNSRQWRGISARRRTRTSSFYHLTNSAVLKPAVNLWGREGEGEALVQRLAPGAHRLVTVTGFGGCGKSALARHVAGRLAPVYAHQICWVDLDSVSDGALVLPTIASALGVPRRPMADALPTLARTLAGRAVLLVLDTCDHLTDACAGAATALLAQCPQLAILATSRQPLGVVGEMRWPLQPLPVPLLDSVTAEDLMGTAAVQLFAARAAAVTPHFVLNARTAPVVAQICQRVDGLPLAIEMVAALVATLALDDILVGLDDALSLLTCGNRSAPPRHQTMRALIDWSYDRLAAQEQTAWRRLSAFSAPFTLDAAEYVACVGEEIPSRPVFWNILGRLVEKSLIEVDWNAELTSYHLLEIARQYGHEKLACAADRDMVLLRLGDTMLQPSLGEFSAYDHALEVALRQALRHLDDVTALNHCDLGKLIRRHWGYTPQGKDLQLALHEAIAGVEKLHERDHQAGLRYRLLQLRYVEKQDVPEITRRLGLSQRQYYRELKNGLEIIGERLLAASDHGTFLAENPL